MKYTILPCLLLSATLCYVPPAHAYTSAMHEFYRVLREANEAYGYVPRYRNHDLEDQIEEQNDQLESQNSKLDSLRQELRDLQYRNANGCIRARGQVPSASINCK